MRILVWDCLFALSLITIFGCVSGQLERSPCATTNGSKSCEASLTGPLNVSLERPLDHRLDSNEPAENDEQKFEYVFAVGINPYLKEEFNSRQVEFLKSLGVELLSDRVRIANVDQAIRRFNERVEQMIKDGTLTRNGALFWCRPYIRAGKLRYLRSDQRVPNGYDTFSTQKYTASSQLENGRRRFKKNAPSASTQVTPIHDLSELLTAAEFNDAIASGCFPGSLSDKNVHYAGGLGGEALFLHDLGHLGGLIEFPKAMARFRKSARAIQESTTEIDQNQHYRFFYANENSLALDSKHQDQLNAILRKVISSQSPEALTREALVDALSKLSAEQLSQIGFGYRLWYRRARLPFGGALRTASLVPDVGNLLDRQYVRLGNGLTDSETIKNIPKELGLALFLANALSQTTPEGWFDVAARPQKLEPGSPYYDYMCSVRQDRLWSSFCVF